VQNQLCKVSVHRTIHFPSTVCISYFGWDKLSKTSILLFSNSFAITSNRETRAGKCGEEIKAVYICANIAPASQPASTVHLKTSTNAILAATILFLAPFFNSVAHLTRLSINIPHLDGVPRANSSRTRARHLCTVVCINGWFTYVWGYVRTHYSAKDRRYWNEVALPTRGSKFISGRRLPAFQLSWSSFQYWQHSEQEMRW